MVPIMPIFSPIGSETATVSLRNDIYIYPGTYVFLGDVYRPGSGRCAAGPGQKEGEVGEEGNEGEEREEGE